jgi:hypothetical protein
MIGLALVIAVLVVVVGILVWREGDGYLDEAAYRVGLELHAIRRRLDVAQLKREVRLDGTRRRRELRDEIDDLNDPGKTQ